MKSVQFFQTGAAKLWLAAFFLIAGLVLPLTTCGSGAPDGGKYLTMSGNQGMGNLRGTPYHYEMWVDAGHAGSVSLLWYGAEQRGGAAFKANWAEPNDYLARIGYFWGRSSGTRYTSLGNVYVDYAYTRSGRSTAGNYSYIGIYGWSENSSASSSEKLVEYYIVEDWFGNQWQSDTTPVGNNTIQGTQVGSFTVDGATYLIYKKTRTGPSIAGSGNTTFTQIFSVRQKPRKSGTISVTEHFKKWEQITSLKFNSLYELKFLVEAGGGKGWLDLSWLELSQETSARE